MSTGKHVEWKLNFHCEETVPGQRFTCVVQLTHPFRGLFLRFDNPDAFAVGSLMVGQINQMVAGVDVPAVVLQNQVLVLPVGVRGQIITLEAINIEGLDPSKLTKVMMRTKEGEPRVTKLGKPKMETKLVGTPFRAELHGQILVGSEDETPRPSTFEGPVLDNKDLN